MVKYSLSIERLISDMKFYPRRSAIICLMNSISAHRSMTFYYVFVLLLCITMGSVWANPEGGSAVVGSVAIQQTSPSRLDVLQQSDKAVIDWQGFNIDVGEHTNFQQPSSSAVTLNRVQGHNPSHILGRLTANGKIFLVNPNGLFFGKGSQTDVAGLVATTADISNQDFLSGRYVFDIASDNPHAAVINQGQIDVAENGFVVLAAPTVNNKGRIHARLGRVALAGANTLTIDFEGDGLLSFSIDAGATQQAGDENANREDTLVTNAGQIIADGGVVEMTTQTAETVIANVINMDGVIQARSVEERNGTIIFSGSPAGKVSVNGTLDASGPDAGETGGTVKVLGEKVGLLDGARINVSGDTGGGEVLVGGNYQGNGPEPNAKHSYVASAAAINADALNNGDGGTIIVWADESADIHGKLTARGGAIAGDGGLVETSARESLTITSSPDASAPNGKGGSWLIDPTDITIVASGGQIGSNTVGADLISNALNSATNVTLDTTLVSGPTGSGDITQNTNAAIEKVDGPAATLTLRAENDIQLNAGITSTLDSLNVIVNADSDGSGAGSIVMNAGAEIISNGGNIILGGGSQPLIRPAVGTASNLAGVELDSAKLSSGGGNITINGRGADDLGDGAHGISLVNGAVVESTTGKIFLQGIGGTGTVNDSSGILLSENSRITTQDGPIRLNGDGKGTGDLAGFRPGRNHGIDLEDTATIEATGKGIIELVGKHTGEAIETADGNLGILMGDIGSNMAPKITTNSGDIALTGESNAIGFPSFGISIQANSAIQSFGGGDIALSGTANAEQGIYTINNGHMATTGLTSFNAGSNDIFMSSSSPNDFGAVNISSARDVTLNDVNDIDLGPMALTGDLEINAAGTLRLTTDSSITTQGGGITMSSAVIDTSAGVLDSSSDIGDGGAIILTTQGGDITTGALNSATNGSTGSSGDITLSVGGVGGSIDTTAGLLDSRANNDLGAGDIRLTAPTSITIGHLDASGTGAVTLTSNEIDLFGGDASVQSQGTLLLQSFTPGQAISLGSTDNIDVNILELTATDLDALTNDFASVTVESGNIGTISIDPAGVSFNNPLSLSGERIEASGPITSSSLFVGAATISMQDVTTTGIQSYNGSVTFNGSYITGGGSFYVVSDAILASNTSITTDGGNVRFYYELNGPGALTLSTGASGDISFDVDVGSITPLSSVSVTNARDISIDRSFVAGPTELHYTGALTGFDPWLEVDSLYIDPNATSATLFGTVAGSSGRDAALVVDGPNADPDFTINGFVIGGEPSPSPSPSPPSYESSYDPAPEPMPPLTTTTGMVDEQDELIQLPEVNGQAFVQIPQEFNMSDFTIEAGVKAGWPLIVDFELTRPGLVQIEITTEDGETVAFSFPGTTERTTSIVTIPQKIGDNPKLASFNVTATETDGSDLVPLQLYGIGAGPKAIGGSAAIDEIQINPPYLRARAHERSVYRFLSHSDFDALIVDFCQVTPGATGDNYQSVNYHHISEGVEANEWTRRTWNGRDKNAQISFGQHKLQIRAFEQVGEGQWLLVWSESFLDVR